MTAADLLEAIRRLCGSHTIAWVTSNCPMCDGAGELTDGVMGVMPCPVCDGHGLFTQPLTNERQ